MIRHIAILFAAALAAQAQTTSPATTGNPLSTEARQAYTSIKNNLIKAAEKMPEEDYNFKPTGDIRTFGQLIGHIAAAQNGICNTARGQQPGANPTGKTSKADLVAALKESFAACDAAFDALTDANATEMMKFRRGERPRLGLLVYNTTHDNEEYGYLAVYMRLKGVVPPSSEGR